MWKNLAYIMLIGLGLSSCQALKPMASSQPVAVKKPTSSPEFIRDIKISPAKEGKKASADQQKLAFTPAVFSSGNASTESLTSLQFKYGILLNVAVEQLTNLKLLQTIEEWYGTSYKYGGTTKMGIDCSAFASTLMMTVFGMTLPRTAKDQYAASQRVDKGQLHEGDLVFFNTRGGISHVGVYLNNNKFVHASTSSGVMISDLSEDYYSQKYVGAGRVL